MATTVSSDLAQAIDFGDKGAVSSNVRPERLEAAKKLAADLQPMLTMPAARRRERLQELAAEHSVTVRTVRRWLTRFEEGGLPSLASPVRSDIGRFRASARALQVVVQAFVSNEPETSAAQIHRTLMRAVPALMRETPSGAPISRKTVLRVRQAMLDDPYARLLLIDGEERREFLRVYAGRVIAEHANHIWQMDMTRCDVMVIDHVSGRIFRPRVHVVIDLFSGVVPGIVFSLEENQAQTDLLLLRALVQKPGSLGRIWPEYGTPEILHADNGSTYISHHAHRVMADLGIKVIHSRPRTSHSRGRVERLMGILHGFERTLPGYVGENAVRRSSEDIRRLQKNTERWRDRQYQRDPGWGNRLLTLDEYQRAVLAWLTQEYHQQAVDGKTRSEHFLETAPRHTLRTYARDDLMLTLAQRTKRIVRPDGTVRLNNEVWTIADGTLIRYVGHEVLVLTNQFAMEAEHVIAFEDRSGGLKVLGEASLMPERADSAEAIRARKLASQEARSALAEARKVSQELTDPELVVSRVLVKEMEAEIDIAPVEIAPRGPRARLQAIEGDRVEEQLPDDEFTRFLSEPPAMDGLSPREYLDAMNAHHRRLRDSKGDSSE